jgi:hypothetical protein
MAALSSSIREQLVQLAFEACHVLRETNPRCHVAQQSAIQPGNRVDCCCAWLEQSLLEKREFRADGDLSRSFEAIAAGPDTMSCCGCDALRHLDDQRIHLQIIITVHRLQRVVDEEGEPVDVPAKLLHHIRDRRSPGQGIQGRAEAAKPINEHLIGPIGHLLADVSELAPNKVNLQPQRRKSLPAEEQRHHPTAFQPRSSR